MLTSACTSDWHKGALLTGKKGWNTLQEGVRTDPVLPHKGERLLADALLADDGLMGSPFLWTVHEAKWR